MGSPLIRHECASPPPVWGVGPDEGLFLRASAPWGIGSATGDPFGGGGGVGKRGLRDPRPPQMNLSEAQPLYYSLLLNHEPWGGVGLRGPGHQFGGAEGGLGFVSMCSAVCCVCTAHQQRLVQEQAPDRLRLS